MQMTEYEILQAFKTAKHPIEQVKIMAELNGVTVGEIKEILTEQGIKPQQLAYLGRKPRGSNNTAREVAVQAALKTEQARLQARLEEIPAQLESLQAEQVALLAKLDAILQATELLAPLYK